MEVAALAARPLSSPLLPFMCIFDFTNFNFNHFPIRVVCGRKQNPVPTSQVTGNFSGILSAISVIKHMPTPWTVLAETQKLGKIVVAGNLTKPPIPLLASGMTILPCERFFAFKQFLCSCVLVSVSQSFTYLVNIAPTCPNGARCDVVKFGASLPRLYFFHHISIAKYHFPTFNSVASAPSDATG